MTMEGIKVEGHRGTWYVIDEGYYNGEKVYLLEHEKHGEEVPSIIVNSDLKIIMEEVTDGLMQLEILELNK